MGRLQITLDRNNPRARYSPETATMLLEAHCRAVLDAEEAVRTATRRLDELVAACRRSHQDGLVDAALTSLNDRRPR